MSKYTEVKYRTWSRLFLYAKKNCMMKLYLYSKRNSRFLRTHRAPEKNGPRKTLVIEQLQAARPPKLLKNNIAVSQATIVSHLNMKIQWFDKISCFSKSLSLFPSSSAPLPMFYTGEVNVIDDMSITSSTRFRSHLRFRFSFFTSQNGPKLC